MVEGGARAIPGSDAAIQDTLYGAPLKVAEYPGAHFVQEEPIWVFLWWCWCGESLSLPVVQNQLLCCADVEMEVVVLAPRCQGSDLLSVVSDQTDDGHVVNKLDESVGALCDYAVMREQGVQARAQHAALRGSGVEGQSGGGVAAYLADLLCLYVNWSRTSESGREEVMKVFHNGGGECYWAVVVEAEGFGLFGDIDNDGLRPTQPTPHLM